MCKEEKLNRWLRFNDCASDAILGKCVRRHWAGKTVSLLDCIHEWEWHIASERKVPKDLYPYLQEQITRLIPDIKWTTIYETKENNYEIIAS